MPRKPLETPLASGQHHAGDAEAPGKINICGGKVSLSPITKFCSQHEFLPTSKPAIIVDTEQENQIAFNEECLSVDSLTDIFAGDDDQFLREYHSAVLK